MRDRIRVLAAFDPLRGLLDDMLGRIEALEAARYLGPTTAYLPTHIKAAAEAAEAQAAGDARVAERLAELADDRNGDQVVAAPAPGWIDCPRCRLEWPYATEQAASIALFGECMGCHRRELTDDDARRVFELAAERGAYRGKASNG